MIWIAATGWSKSAGTWWTLDLPNGFEALFSSTISRTSPITSVKTGFLPLLERKLKVSVSSHIWSFFVIRLQPLHRRMFSKARNPYKAAGAKSLFQFFFKCFTNSMIFLTVRHFTWKIRDWGSFCFIFNIFIWRKQKHHVFAKICIYAEISIESDLLWQFLKLFFIS